MTLVTALTIGKHPLMIGDLLITANRDSVMDFPALGRQRIQLPDGNFAVTLMQKVVLVSERLAVGWAGPVDGIRQMLSDMLAANDKDPAPESVRDV